MNVEEIMTRHVKTCAQNATLEQAAQIMWENDCGVVPLVDDDGRVTSVITDRDICMAGFTQGQHYWEIPITTAASKRLLAVRPSDSIEHAEEMMRNHQVRRLAVTDGNGKLVGMLSLNDLARRAGRRADDLGLDGIAKTLSAICQPGHRPVASDALALA